MNTLVGERKNESHLVGDFVSVVFSLLRPLIDLPDTTCEHQIHKRTMLLVYVQVLEGQSPAVGSPTLVVSTELRVLGHDRIRNISEAGVGARIPPTEQKNK